MFARHRVCSRYAIATLVAAAVLGPVVVPATAEAGASDVVTVEGIARRIIGDDIDGAHAHAVDPHWVVETGDELMRVELPANVTVEPGDELRVRGTFDGDELVPAPGGVTNEGGPIAAQAGPTGTKRVAVLMVNFPNDQSEPFSKETVEATMFGEGESARTYYEQSSDGALQLEGEVFDWYTLPSADLYCSINTFLYEGLNKPEFDDNGFDYTMLLFPPRDTCPFAGAGMLPGPYSWINGLSLNVINHELGHNFGAHHANGLLCDDGEGTKVMFSSSCVSNEYGDPFSAMGSGGNLHHNWHRTALGYLDSTQTVTASGDYALAPSADADAEAPRALRIERGDGTFFWLEQRQNASPFDEWHPILPATQGVLIRKTPETNVQVQSDLIDCTPGTNWWWADAPCLPGVTFEDPTSGIEIETLSVSSEGAVVRITITPDTQPPSLPGNVRVTSTALTSVALAWNASTDNRAVAGYRIYRDNVLIKTQTGTTFTDTKRKPNTTYSYAVVAVDASGNATAKTAAKLGTTKKDTLAPSMPGAVKARRGANGVTITWNASSDNVGLTGYRVFRNGVAIKALTGRSFVHKPGRGTFTYSVAAFDGSGNVSKRGVAPAVKIP